MALAGHPFAVYVMRHGETAFNAQGRYQGARDDSPLTVRGRQQAVDIALRLKDVFDNPDPPRFVSSPLGRATTTTQVILETLGLPDDAYTTDYRLREIDLGEHQGLRIEDRRREILPTGGDDGAAAVRVEMRRRAVRGRNARAHPVGRHELARHDDEATVARPPGRAT